MSCTPSPASRCGFEVTTDSTRVTAAPDAACVATPVLVAAAEVEVEVEAVAMLVMSVMATGSVAGVGAALAWTEGDKTRCQGNEVSAAAGEWHEWSPFSIGSKALRHLTAMRRRSFSTAAAVSKPALPLAKTRAVARSAALRW